MLEEFSFEAKMVFPSFFQERGEEKGLVKDSFLDVLFYQEWKDFLTPGQLLVVLRKFQEIFRHSEGKPLMSRLTPREMEILEYVARGCLNKEIAVELGISEQTIKNHITSILRKLNANARTEAVVVAIKQGLITIQTNADNGSKAKSRT